MSGENYPARMGTLSTDFQTNVVEVVWLEQSQTASKVMGARGDAHVQFMQTYKHIFRTLRRLP